MVTNYGDKAIIVDSDTVNNFPSSLTISNLMLAGTSLSTNTLLLNYTGTSHPLRVFNRITVNPNAVLLNLSGSISLEGDNAALMVSGGVVNQDGGSNFFGGNCYIGYTTNFGWYNLTNGTLWMSNVVVDSGGTFNQMNGTTKIAGYLYISQAYYYVGNGAQWTVAHGALTSDLITVSGAGHFYQGDSEIVVTNRLMVGMGASRFTADNGSYYMTNGTLTTGTTTIGAVADGYFYQYGGTHRTGALLLDGEEPYGFGRYELDAGNLQCAGDETIGYFASLLHNSGTNRVGGQLIVFNGTYTLNGGLLCSSNVVVQGDGSFPAGFEPTITQTTAGHIVTNTLTVGPFATYNLNGGTLNAGAIELTQSGSYPPGYLNHSGGTLTSGGTVFSGGTLVASGTEMLGTLTLRGSNSLDLLSTNSTQCFEASAQIPWESNAVLEIDGWQSGVNHIYVGHSADALTPRQLQQIIFGQSAGYGKLLETGELVSWPVPPLIFNQTSTNLTLSWPGIAVLQWADDPAGPYTDVPDATSPYTPPLTAPQKFFRLRNS